MNPSEEQPQALYRLNGGGAELAVDRIEEDCLTAEVIVSWGDAHSVLSVAHVGANESFAIGDGTPFPVADMATFAVVENSCVQLPENAERIDGGDGRSAVLDESLDVRFAVGELQIRVRGVRAGKRIAPRRSELETQPLFMIGGTMALAGVFLAIMSLVPPHSMAMSSEMLNTESRLVEVFMAAQEEELFEDVVETGPSGGDEGGAERGDEGAAGDPDEAAVDRAYAIEGRARPEERRMSRQEQTEQAARAGIIGVLAAANNLRAPTSVYGADTAIGSDPMSALGAMYGVDLGDANGFGGLGLRGTGRHGGGDALGTIGLGERGIGHGLGCEGDGPCLGGGQGPSGAQTSLRRRGPRVPPPFQVGRPEVNGDISAETIRRVVRRHHNEIRFCFERSLQSNPDLSGRVTTRFVIAPTGGVVASAIASSTLNHAATESCVRTVIGRLTFPAAERGGVVSVNYPFTFSSPPR